MARDNVHDDVGRAGRKQGGDAGSEGLSAPEPLPRVVWNLELMSVLETERRLNKWR